MDGSVTFWYCSGSADSCLWPNDKDPAPDPAIFVLDLQDANKKLFFALSFCAYYFLKVHSHHFSKIKSHKEVTGKHPETLHIVALSHSSDLDTWRLSLHGPGRAAQRLSGDLCGPHSFSCLLILLQIKSFQSLCHGEFCSHFWNT